ncbi:MAG: YegP family protein [Lachnospiraceae bacterium]|nr:YegP family protein [Lachnospiraceae bacterium]
MGVFVIKQTKAGAFMFNLKAKNGEVIASSQQYKAIGSCKKGIRSVMKNSTAADIEDQTVENYEVKKNPKFEVYLDAKGETRFRLRAANGQNICHGEGYSSKRSCLNGIASIRKNAPDAEIKLELDQ